MKRIFLRESEPKSVDRLLSFCRWIGSAALFVALSNLPVAADDSLCEKPRAQAKVGFFKEAYESYSLLLNDNSPPPCAPKELVALSEVWAKHEFEIGSRYAEACYYDKALEAYGHALSLNPEDKDIVKAIAETRSAKVAAQIAVGKALAAAGDVDKLLEAYDQALNLNPKNKGIVRAIAETRTAKVAAQIDVGEAFAKAGDVDKAAKAFKKALDLEPDNSTAAAALKEVLKKGAPALQAAAQIDIGEAFAKAGDVDKAAEAFKKALALKPDDPTAAAALEKVLKKKALAKVQAQAQLGEYDQAADKFIEARGQNPTIEMPQQSLGFRWQRWRGNALSVLVAVGETIAVLLILGMPFWRLATRYLRRPILSINTFIDDELGTEVGTGFAAALKGAYYTLAQGSAVAPVSLRVKKPVQGSQVPDTTLGKVVPTPISWLQALPAFLGNIFPRRAYLVEGSLHKSETQGAGVTVWLVGPKKFSGSHTFWEADYCGNDKTTFIVKSQIDPGSYYHLAGYAATWLLYRLQEEGFQLLGTKNWNAYTMFQAGLNAEKFRDKSAARDLYVKALRYDSGFDAARLNLSLLADRPQYHLTLGPIKGAADNSEPTDPTHYQARYVHAVRLYEIGDAAKALSEGQVLLKKIDTTLEKLCPVRRPMPLSYLYLMFKSRRSGSYNEDRDGELRTYLNGLKPIAESMLVGLRIVGGGNLKDEMKKLDEISSEAATPRVHFNLACSYSVAAATAREKTDRQTEEVALEKSLKSLETALLLNPKFAPNLKEDETLKEVRSSKVKIGVKKVEDLFNKLIEDYSAQPQPPEPL